MPTTAAEARRPLASGGITSLRSLLAITVFGAAFALGTQIATAASLLFDTTRVLTHTNNECLVLPTNKCVSIASPQVTVGARLAQKIELACVPEFPYLVGWDAAQNEQIGLTLASAPPGSRNRSPDAEESLRSDRSAGARAVTAANHPESITVLAINQADAPGFVTLFIGCAAQPVVGAPFPSSREAVPTNHPSFMAPAP